MPSAFAHVLGGPLAHPDRSTSANIGRNVFLSLIKALKDLFRDAEGNIAINPIKGHPIAIAQPDCDGDVNEPVLARAFVI